MWFVVRGPSLIEYVLKIIYVHYMLEFWAYINQYVSLHPYGTWHTGSILEVCYQYAKYAYLSKYMHTRIILKRTPPILTFQYVLRLGPSMLQVYFKYTWAEPENILGPYLEKYVISIYLEKYTSGIILQVHFKESSPSILQGVFAKYASRSLRQVYFKHTWLSMLQVHLQ